MNRKLLTLFFSGGVSVLMLGGLFFASLIKDLPSPELLENRRVAQSTKIFDRTGENLLYEIHGEEKRTVIPFDEIPDIVKQATLAIEDENFYNHGAFDFRAIARAFFTNLLSGRIKQGGSTITQQLAKNAFLSPERTITRKLKELILAIRLENKYDKDEILSLYLNQIPYGSNAYGIEAAAQTFFKKSAKELNLAEAALLASLPRAPSYYSPYGNHVDELMERKNRTLEKMVELKYITREEAEKAKQYKFKFANPSTEIKAPHFVIAVQDYLNKNYGEDFVKTAGLKVITTLDLQMQEIAENAVKKIAERNTEMYQGHNAALVVEDPRTGQILAMVGSKDYFGEAEPEGCKPGVNCRFEGNFNVALHGLRQPGSAIKPFVYLGAFYKGYTPETVVFDVPTEFRPNHPDCPIKVDFKNNNDACYHPKNFDEKFRGPVTFRQALGQSINVPSVKVLYLAGIDNVLSLVKKMGITTLTERGRYGLSLVLGGGEVTLTELVGAYSVFAQDGVYHPQTLILEITDSRGRTIEKYENNKGIQVIEPQYARFINDILSDIKTRSGLFQNSLNLTVFPEHEIALKTGTTNDYRDAWTIGYTPSLTIGVWAGNNDNTPMHKKGSSLLAAVPIWHEFAKNIIPKMPSETFKKPEPVFKTHPILNGQYTVVYKTTSEYYPQIHSLLYYFQKNSPQFKNWEEPVLEWAEKNIPNFKSEYNKPLPADAKISSLEKDLINIDIKSPKNGSFIKQNQITINASISSETKLARLEIKFNGQLLKIIPLNTNQFNYYDIINVNPKLQNKLSIKVFNTTNNQIIKEIILYK